MKDQKYHKVRDHCHYTEEYRGVEQSICNLKYSAPKNLKPKNPIVFSNGSNCDYHFIIKELAEEVKKTIYLFRRKHRKIHNFYGRNRKRSYENCYKREKKFQKITYIHIYIHIYILRFKDSTRFMASLLSNLSEVIHKNKREYGQDDKKVRLAESNISIVTVFMNIQTLKMI